MQVQAPASSRKSGRWIRHARTGDAVAGDITVKIDGMHKRRETEIRLRIALSLAVFVAFYGILGARLIYMAGLEPAEPSYLADAASAVAAARPDIVDRNGELLATDVAAYAVYAEPNRMVDVDDAVDRLASVLPDLDRHDLTRKLEKSSAFEWVMREVTPRQKEHIHDLGIPGLGFYKEARRFYPAGPLSGHILGAVNVDNKGLSGMEMFLDRQGLGQLQDLGFAKKNTEGLKPFQLSVDMRVQHVVRSELMRAMTLYKAIAAIGIVMDTQTGEVVAMSSLPDYDPNDRAMALDKARMNRASAGVFEMGSVFKTFTTAAALDSGRVSLSDTFDARQPIRMARRTIRDFHAKSRILSVPEVFIYSSNIGTAKMAMALGIEGQKDYLKRLGLLDRSAIELPEAARPLLPPKWSELAAMTVSFGHGLSVTPLQVAAACVALVNGGYYIPPTFMPRTPEEAKAVAVKVLDEKTSQTMRLLMRLNVEKGSGRRADVEGLYVGGKTGTAEKVVNGVYDGDKRLNSFLSVFPADHPRYVVLVTIDEPQPEEGQFSATAGLNAAPTTGRIIERIGPMLNVMPRFDLPSAATQVAFGPQ
jgi:cell division protein FtsI (penicillin-binding protein 3)